MAIASILDYKGNAALGGNMPQVGGVSQQAMDSFAALNRRKNEVADAEYQQKINDRDRVFNAISQMQADLDKVLPEDLPRLKKQVDDLTDKLMQPDVFDDQQLMAEVQKGISDFKVQNAYAKTNYKTIAEETIAASKITDPEKRQKMLQHIREQRARLTQDPTQLYDPYKQDLTVDFDTLLPKGESKTKIIGSTGFYDKTLTYTDPASLVMGYDKQQLDPMGSVTKNQWDMIRSSWFDSGVNDGDKAEELQRWNQKILQAQEFVSPDQKDMIKQVPDDFIRAIAEGREPVFTADFTKNDFDKAMLVANRFNQKEADIFNEARVEAAKGQADIDLKKAQKSKAYSDAESNRIRAIAYRDKMEKAAGDGDKDAIAIKEVYDQMVNKIKYVPVNDKSGLGGTFLIQKGDIPDGFSDIGGVATDPKKGLVSKTIDFKKSGNNYEYLAINFIDRSSGLPIDPYKDSRLAEGYKKVLENNRLSKKDYPYIVYLRDAIKNRALDVEFKGANSTANYTSLAQSIRYKDARGSKKGKESIFSDEDYLPPEE